MRQAEKDHGETGTLYLACFSFQYALPDCVLKYSLRLDIPAGNIFAIDGNKVRANAVYQQTDVLNSVQLLIFFSC